MPGKAMVVDKRWFLLIMALGVAALSLVVIPQKGNAQTAAKKSAVKGTRQQSGVVRKVKPVPPTGKVRKKQ